MRRVLLFLSICVFSFSEAQNAIPISDQTIKATEGRTNEIVSFLYRKFYEELDTYCQAQNLDNLSYVKFSGANQFKKRLKEVFSTVVTTNANTVENGSAFAYVKDKDKNVFSVNGAIFMGMTLLDVGISTKFDSDNYQFYSDKTWSNDVTGSFGLSRVLNFANSAGRKRDYISKCDSLNQRRRQFVIDTLMPKYDKLYKWVYNPATFIGAYPANMKVDLQQNYAEIQAGGSHANDDLLKAYVAATIRIEEINNQLRGNYMQYVPIAASYMQPATTKVTVTNKPAPNAGVSNGTIEVDGKKTADIKTETAAGEKTTVTEIKEPDLRKELIELIDIRATAVELLKLRDNKEGDRHAVKTFVDKKFQKFDTKNDISAGYRIWWFSIKASVSNSAIAVNRDSIVVDSVHRKITNLFKGSIEISSSVNWNVDHFVYLKVFMRANRGSLLDSRILRDGGFNVSPVTAVVEPGGEQQVVNYDLISDTNKPLGHYNDLKHPVYNMDVGAYGAWLFAKSKTFGITGQTNFNFPIERRGAYYKPSYTVLAGLIMKTAADKVIVNLACGFENQYHNENALDDFLVKASIGVPFTIFEKAKK